MRPLLFVCTTCDRYAPHPARPTRGETLLASVRAEAARRGVAHLVHAAACVMSCPRPCGAALREGRGGGLFRFALLSAADAPALVAFAQARAADAVAPLPPSLAPRLASYILPRS